MSFLKNIISYVMNTLESIVIVGSFFILTYLFIGFPTKVIGASMEPTLHTNDRLLVSKVSYKFHQVQRGDVVVLQSPANHDIELVKRVIGLPNESITFKNGNVYINGKLLDEPYISDKTPVWLGGYVKEGEGLLIQKDTIFVMGDNRPRSSDSREFGPIPLSSVIGKAEYKYFPDNEFIKSESGLNN